MSSSNPPLEVFLIRSFSSRRLPNLARAPTSCKGFVTCNSQFSLQQTSGGLTGLCIYSLPPGVTQYKHPNLHMVVRDPRDLEFPIRVILRQQRMAGEYVYSLITQELGLPDRQSEIRCKEPWGFASELLATLGKKLRANPNDENSVIKEEQLLALLKTHTDPVAITFEQNFTVFSD